MATRVVPRIDLFDMLLLGAPGGKTELIEGHVSRVLVAPTEAEARRVFLELAHQLHDLYRVDWDERSVQGSVALGRMSLGVNGRLVELEVQMTPKIWRAFADG